MKLNGNSHPYASPAAETAKINALLGMSGIAMAQLAGRNINAEVAVAAFDSLTVPNTQADGMRRVYRAESGRVALSEPATAPSASRDIEAWRREKEARSNPKPLSPSPFKKH